jgi:hypothetical protein
MRIKGDQVVSPMQSQLDVRQLVTKEFANVRATPMRWRNIVLMRCEAPKLI